MTATDQTTRIRRALCALERALGWDPSRRSRVNPDLSSRIECALNSAEFAGMLAPGWSGRRTIKRAAVALRRKIDKTKTETMEGNR